MTWGSVDIRCCSLINAYWSDTIASRSAPDRERIHVGAYEIRIVLLRRSSVVREFNAFRFVSRRSVRRSDTLSLQVTRETPLSTRTHRHRTPLPCDSHDSHRKRPVVRIYHVTVRNGGQTRIGTTQISDQTRMTHRLRSTHSHDCSTFVFDSLRTPLTERSTKSCVH